MVIGAMRIVTMAFTLTLPRLFHTRTSSPFLMPFFLGELFADFDEVGRNQFVEPRNVAGLRARLPVFRHGVGRHDVRVLFHVAALDRLVVDEAGHRVLTGTVQEILRGRFPRLEVLGERAVRHRVREEAGVLFPGHEEGVVIGRIRGNEVADVGLLPLVALPLDEVALRFQGLPFGSADARL